MRSVPHAFAAAAVLASCATAASAQATPEKDEDVRYLLGAAVSFSPEYDGANQHKARLRPVWAVRFGRIRIASGGGSALLGFGRTSAGDGASAQLVENDRWRLGLSLRMDSGRDSGDAGTTRGLPDVKRTLRAKLYANYALTTDWSLGASLSQDLLGRKGGLVGSVDLGWRFYRSESTEWTTGVGVSAGNAQNLRSYFGVPASAVEASGKPAYEPGAGLRDVSVGVGFKHTFDKHWFVFGSVGANRLLGPAAHSPLVQKASNQAAAIGVAWRN